MQRGEQPDREADFLPDHSMGAYHYVLKGGHDSIPGPSAAYRKNELRSSGLVLIGDTGGPNCQSGGYPRGGVYHHRPPTRLTGRGPGNLF
jgi:hypothetical protein